ncbi:MAG: hypothetical protein K0B02_00600 [DPANN group archaeon]|nr:hypothetical protein [DPANN group archaeon]
MYKTLKVTKRIHTKLLCFISQLQLDTGERVTMDHAISILLNNKCKDSKK